MKLDTAQSILNCLSQHLIEREVRDSHNYSMMIKPSYTKTIDTRSCGGCPNDVKCGEIKKVLTAIPVPLPQK